MNARLACFVVTLTAFMARAQGVAADSTSGQGAPSPLEFHWAMESSLPSSVDGETVMLGHCAPARQVRCEPPQPNGLSLCRFRDPESRAAALVKIDGVWRYKSGDRLRRCSVTTLGPG